MWVKRTTSAEGKNYSNSRVLGYGQLGRTAKAMCKVLETLDCVEEIDLERVFPTGTNELVRGGDGFGTMGRVWWNAGGVPEKPLKWCFLKDSYKPLLTPPFLVKRFLRVFQIKVFKK